MAKRNRDDSPKDPRLYPTSKMARSCPTPEYDTENDDDFETAGQGEGWDGISFCDKIEPPPPEEPLPEIKTRPNPLCLQSLALNGLPPVLVMEWKVMNMWRDEFKL